MSKHKFPPFFCSRLVFRPNLTHWAKKKGGKIFAPKDLVRGWACLQGKNVHFLKTMEARCLDAIWVSGVVQYNPQGCFIKFYGLGCWGWAVVGSDSWDIQKYATPSKTLFWHHPLFSWLINKKNICSDTSWNALSGPEKPAKLFQKAPLRNFIVLKLSNPSQKSVCDDLDCVIFS